MAQWIEVKVRYDKTVENGAVKRVTEPYLVDALSCTEAETRVMEELTPFSSDINVTSTAKTKVAEVFLQFTGDKYYRVKVNFITLDEKTAAEKKSASYIIVPADNFAEALENFNGGMRGTMADFEIESIAETKIVEVYRYKTPQNQPSTFEMAERVAADEKVQRAVKQFRESVPEGTTVSVSCTCPDGKMSPEVVVVDKSSSDASLAKKSKPKSNDD